MIKINSIDAQSDIYYNTNNYHSGRRNSKTQLIQHKYNNSNAQSILFINNSSDDDSGEYEDMYNNDNIKQRRVTPKTPMNNNNIDIDNALQYAAKTRISQEINYLKEEFDEESENNENKMENETENETENDIT